MKTTSYERSTITILFFLFCWSAYSQVPASPVYKNKENPVDVRLKDLMSRMTLEEKVGQLVMAMGKGGGMAARTESVKDDEDLRKLIAQDPNSFMGQIQRGEVGSTLQVMSLDDGNALQRVAMQSRLGIPLLIGSDVIHGAGWTDENTTIFPSPITLAATFNPSLVKKIGTAAAQEARCTGARWIFAPNVDVARDPRWGRMGETFGEDVLLVSDMAQASVEGMQVLTPDGYPTVAACIKHFVGGGQSVNGMNGAPFMLDENVLRNSFFPPFERGIQSGALTLMAAHNETLGVPCHSSQFLLDQVLRQEWGFKGMIVSDWGDVSSLVQKHQSAKDLEDAVLQAAKAGIDVYMLGISYGNTLISLIKDKRLSEQELDRSVENVLRLKFKLGLFDQPYVDKKEQTILRSPEHLQLSLQAARQGVVLLSNKNNILPLRAKSKILLTGPNVDNASVVGDWVLGGLEHNAITVLQGMKQEAPAGTEIVYAKTGDVHSITDASIQAAVEKAKNCDVVVVAVGEISLRSNAKMMTCGENHDRISLELFGRQNDLLRALYATGKPVVVVVVSGRANQITEHVTEAAAVLEAFEPGEFGGQAIAEILYGKINPSGKLPVTMPRHEGQLPIYYCQQKSAVNVPNEKGMRKALFSFGYGLSYTTFSYSNLRVPANLKSNELLDVSVDVTNTGACDGDEVVLVYSSDRVRSVPPPVKELVAYTRVSLKSGETRTINFKIPFKQFAFFNAKMRKVVEAGDFTIGVDQLASTFHVDKDFYFDGEN